MKNAEVLGIRLRARVPDEACEQGGADATLG